MNKKTVIKTAGTVAAVVGGLMFLSSLRSVIDLGRWVESSRKEYNKL